MFDNSVIDSMLTTLKEVFSNPVILPTITFLLGLLGGHHFALWRDKRKEFNEASSPLFLMLTEGINRNTTTIFPDIIQLEIFEQHISFGKKRAYKLAVENLKESLNSDREAFIWDFDICEHKFIRGYESQSKDLARKVLNYLKRK